MRSAGDTITLLRQRVRIADRARRRKESGRLTERLFRLVTAQLKREIREDRKLRKAS